jgi:hypothetical protein
MLLRLRSRDRAVKRGGPPAKVLEGPYEMELALASRTYDISSDGQRFLFVKRSTNQVTPQIVVVQNWLEELRRLVRRDKSHMRDSRPTSRNGESARSTISSDAVRLTRK